MESLFIKFGNHGNKDDACVELFFCCFLGRRCFIKGDDGGMYERKG